MANKNKPVTREEVESLHNEWWNSLTNEQKQKLVDEQLGESGSPMIRNMIKEQLDGAGISLTSDEHVVVEINPSDDYKIDEKHSALVLR